MHTSYYQSSSYSLSSYQLEQLEQVLLQSMHTYKPSVGTIPTYSGYPYSPSRLQQQAYQDSQLVDHHTVRTCVRWQRRRGIRWLIQKATICILCKYEVLIHVLVSQSMMYCPGSLQLVSRSKVISIPTTSIVRICSTLEGIPICTATSQQ